jgi:hypothetical protein
MFPGIWLILFTIGLPVQILETHSFDKVSQALFIALILFIISSYTSSIVVVIRVAIIKRKRFKEIIKIFRKWTIKYDAHYKNKHI